VRGGYIFIYAKDSYTEQHAEELEKECRGPTTEHKHIHIYICKYMFICIHKYVYIYTHIYVYVYLCMCVHLN